MLEPYSTVLGGKHTFFLFDHYEFIEKGDFEEGTFLNSTNDSVHPDDYHVLKCGESMFTKMKLEVNLSFYEYDDEEMSLEDEGEIVGETELGYYIGSIEKVKLFNQKSVTCFDTLSVYAFRQGGRQCICKKNVKMKNKIIRTL